MLSTAFRTGFGTTDSSGHRYSMSTTNDIWCVQRKNIMECIKEQYFHILIKDSLMITVILTKQQNTILISLR